MVVVIADDLTGAAELAGIGLRYRLHVELATAVNPHTTADLLVISADTRSLKEAEAVETVSRITQEVAKLHPGLIYKKVDSVLRGHVVAELKGQMKVLNQQRVLLAPANPALGRTIQNGIYLYNNKPLHLSSFSNDPEFAIITSDVIQMLNAPGVVSVSKKDGVLPNHGIIVAEVSDEDDLHAWASRVDSVFVAGAATFFNAILNTGEIRGLLESKPPKAFGQPVLFVCGTTFARSRNTIKQLSRSEGPVAYMPENIIALASEAYDDDAYEKWRNEIVSLMHKHGKAIVAIDEEVTASLPTSASSLRLKTANVIKAVFEKLSISELFIEGGSTAAAIIRQLDFTTFYPEQELSLGVVRMAVHGQEDLCITVKPGSYEWPANVWNF